MDPFLFALVSSLYTMQSYAAVDHYFILIIASIFIWLLARKQISIQCFLKNVRQVHQSYFSEAASTVEFESEKQKTPTKKTESLKLPYHIIKTEIYFSIISNSSSCLRNCSRPDRRLSMHSILSAYFPECQLNWTDEGNMALKEEGPWHKSHS